MPDGSTAEIETGGDPRFGTQAAFAAKTVLTLPSDTQLSQTTRRTATVSSPGDPTTLTAKTESTVVNGKTSSTAYASSTKRYTSTSPAGRQWKVDVDAKGRIVRSEVAGADPVVFAYDSRGRIDTVTAGSRSWNYAYASTGYLQTVQGPEGTSASYSTDANGRVTTATLPGSRQVAFSYDARGNAGELASRTDTSTGQTTTYLNSARGLVGADLPDGTQVRYDLDAMGRRAAVRTDGIVTRRYLYGL